MKFLIIPTILIILIVANIVAINGFLNTSNASAIEYSPDDFQEEYQNYSVTVGIDRNDGRFIRYEYIYKD